MAAIIFVTILTLAGVYCVWNYALVPNIKKGAAGSNNAMFVIGALFAAFVLRIILAAAYKGHNTDMSCFIGWSGAIFEHGITKFYSLDMFHDYPPGYMYILYFVGAVTKLFGFTDGALYAVVKMPAIICDIIIGFIIYKIAKKKFSDGISAIIASLYLFNPAAILNCSLWGQVDSVYTLFALLMIYFITEKKMIYSYFMFAVCLFIKPQAFIFTPVVIGAIINNVFLDDFSWNKLWKNVGFGLGAIALIFILSLPFGLGNVVTQYKATLASYPHITVNAFNIWGAMGKNWAELTAFSNIIGYLSIAAITVFSVFLLIKSKQYGKYYFAGALLTFLTFMLSVKMHDRYAFPAIALFIAAFAAAPAFKGMITLALISASQFFNTAWVLFIYEKDINKYFRSPVVTVASLINIAVAAFIVYYSYKDYVQNKFTELAPVKETKDKKSKASVKQSGGKKTSSSPSGKKTSSTQKIFASDILPKIARVDIIAMIVITVVYSCIALADLGDMKAPQTEYDLSKGSVAINFDTDKQVKQIKFFLGSHELEPDRSIKINAYDQSGNATYTKTISSGAVFYWSSEDVNTNIASVSLSSDSDILTIKELAFVGSDGNLITPANVSPGGASVLFDEQDMVPERSTFRNSTYFDEIYHARTAYEFIHHLSVYEWTHPPLGKVFIALGVLIFGMCPFGWRIAGTVFGIIMIPVIYMFAKKLLKKSWLAIVTCLLFTFDFMHFAQTRIATIDVYVTFFIMLMYYFMYKYYSTSFYDTDFKKGLGMLALSGTAMGLGIASKWTGIYAGAGLGVLFFITLLRRYNEYRYAVDNPKGETDGISHKFIIDNFKPYMIKTLLWCVIFFVIVPIIIYLLAYIPYLGAPDQSGLKSIFNNQSAMLTYHSKTVLSSTHPYSSRWYEWIIMKRPIWYYSGTISDKVKEGISSFGNPLVWWAGVPAFFYMVYLAVKRDKNALFLAIAYLAQLVSWIPVTRLTFIYHYFPCVPFIALMIGYAMKSIYDKAKNKKAAMYTIFGYTALAVFMFVMFYPVLSGHPCTIDYAKNFLKWFDTWVLL